ncbi:hypothetical protein ACFZAG_35950 [Streptomyces sp. NPDC012403]|uniref:hypothetical protein n=1 Tax=Streptomyces sp. NPDC012403 TaxID=3364831 RepID=UPI0036E31B2E
MKVLEEVGRRYWAPRRYETYYRQAMTATHAGGLHVRGRWEPLPSGPLSVGRGMMREM